MGRDCERCLTAFQFRIATDDKEDDEKRGQSFKSLAVILRFKAWWYIKDVRQTGTCGWCL